MNEMQTLLTAKQYHSIDSLKACGLSYYKISKLVENGTLRKINRKYYESALFQGEPNGLLAVRAYAESGIVSLLSAAVYHGLSEERPQRIDVAIPRGSRIPDSPEWPEMRFLFFSEPRYSLGVEKIDDGHGNAFSVYDKEKTVCDLMFYRNKLGFEAAMSAIRNYLHSEDKDIDKLLSYADSLRMGKTMRKTLEVMLYD